jgi:hypothetical protein
MCKHVFIYRKPLYWWLQTLSCVISTIDLDCPACVSVLHVQPWSGPNRKHRSSVDVGDTSHVLLQQHCLPGNIAPHSLMLCDITADTETICYQAVASQWPSLLIKLFQLSVDMPQYLYRTRTTCVYKYLQGFTVGCSIPAAHFLSLTSFITFSQNLLAPFSS